MFKNFFRWLFQSSAQVSFCLVNTDTIILTNGNNASVAYILQPYLAQRGIDFSLLHSGDRLVSSEPLEMRCKRVVIARYLPACWIIPLQAFKSAGGQIVYFMDDDLMDPHAAKNLPRDYRCKIYKTATRQRKIIESLCNEFWMASPYLVNKYREWAPILLTPQPMSESLMQLTPVTVCYHGTASHMAEIDWLAKVMFEVQCSSAQTSFELFGDHRVNKLFRGMPRTSVLHPMDWPNYLTYSGSILRDIALAPLLPQPFNAGRGPTKFFDFARMGAVGIYTDVEPYRGFIHHGIDGLLLPNDERVWISTIAELAADPVRRKRMALAARARAVAMAVAAPVKERTSI
jgi:hypothetical protein